MIDKSELLVIGFLSLGGLVATLPVVLLGKLKIAGIVKGIGAFMLLVVASAGFYLVTTDATLLEVLTLKADSIWLPKRIFSVSYTMIIVLLGVLPIAALKLVVSGKSENA